MEWRWKPQKASHGWKRGESDLAVDPQIDRPARGESQVLRGENDHQQKSLETRRHTQVITIFSQESAGHRERQCFNKSSR